MSLPGVIAVRVRYEDRSVDVTFNDEMIAVEKIKEVVGREMGLAMEEGEVGGKKEEGAAETCPM